MATDEQKSRQASRHLRISLIRDILIIAIAILVAWKLLNAQITLDFRGFHSMTCWHCCWHYFLSGFLSHSI